MMDFILNLLRLILVEFLATWPTVFCIVAFAYREQFADFLKRAIEIGPAGAKAVPPPIQQIPGSAAFAGTGDSGTFTGTVECRQADSGVSLPAPGPILADTERTILEYVKQRGIDKLNIDDQKNLFVREYALLWIRSQFQSIGVQIYGTQIALLRRLDNSSPQSEAALTPIFEDHKKRIQAAGITFRVDFLSWIAFKLNTKLVAVNADGLYSITQLGKQFLNVYAPASNLTEGTRRF